MKRFLMFVGVAVVAGAMYVAASPASQQAKAPTAKQFKALKKQVATLSKTLKTVKTEANVALGIIANCYVTVSGNSAPFNVLPVSQFGTTASGFLFGPPGGAGSTARTALDVAPTGTTPQAYLQEVTPACVTSGALRHAALHSGSSRLLRLVDRTR